jgi:hypothetical protein
LSPKPAFRCIPQDEDIEKIILKAAESQIIDKDKDQKEVSKEISV